MCTSSRRRLGLFVFWQLFVIVHGDASQLKKNQSVLPETLPRSSISAQRSSLSPPDFGPRPLDSRETAETLAHNLSPGTS